MKVLIGIVLVASLALTGCMSNPRRDHINAVEAEMNAGRMKQSDGLILIYNDFRAMNNAEGMKVSSYLLDAALAYESGKTTRAEYHSHWRKSETYIATVRQQRKQDARRSVTCRSNFGIIPSVTCK